MPRYYRLRGCGGYGRTIGRKIGRHVGRYFGLGSTGAGVGGNIGNLVSRALERRLLGQGSYTVQNSLFGGTGNRPPTFASAGDENGGIRITYREYLGDMFGNPTGTSFTNDAFALNPGISQTFPWLSEVAANFDEYEFEQLVFNFRTTTSDIGASTTGQVGTVIMCTDYNASAYHFTDKNEMMQYSGAMSSKATDSMLHGVECSARKMAGTKTKYIRVVPANFNDNLKDYDLGTFQIAIANTPTGFANQTIGELWVAYTVKLMKPKLSVSYGLTNDQDLFLETNPGASSIWGVQSSSTLNKGAYNTIGTTYAIVAGTDYGECLQIQFPPQASGVYRIASYCVNAGTTDNVSWIPPVTAGNVYAYYDIWGSGQQVAGNYTQPLWWSSGTIALATSSAVYVMCDVIVHPQTGGITNSVTFEPDGITMPAVGTMYTEIRQLPSTYYMLNGSNPIWVNVNSGLINQAPGGSAPVGH